MILDTLNYLLRFVLLVFFQIAIINNIDLSTYVNPYIYIAFILSLRILFLKFLNTIMNETNEIETINFDNYISIDLNVDMVLKALFEKDDPDYELDFPKDRLISDSFMDDLICFVNDGNKIKSDFEEEDYED